MTASDGFDRIAVLGGGIVALSAATAFARALPRSSITLIATPPDPAALADRMEGTLPAIKRFNDLIGIDEADMLRRAGTTHRIGTRFEHWSADGAPWLHIYGAHGPAAMATFHQHWLHARRAGDATPFHAYSPGVVLAMAERFAPPIDDPASPLADFDYALRIDPAGYRAGLTALARHVKIALSEGVPGGIEQGANGLVSALLLEDGRRIEADLFLDCTGPGAVLLSRIDTRFEDWGEALPCDRLVFAASAPPALSLTDTVTATGCGWHWRSPGRARTAAGLAYAGAITPDDEAARLLQRETGQAPAETVSLRPGRRPESWIGNVIAFGDAAVAVDPLQATNLHLAQNAILRALDLLPDRSCPPLVLREYNRRTADEAARVRDFLALHYLRSGRQEGAFWRSMPRRAVPDSLAFTLEQFEGRGRLPHFEEESFDRDDWLSVLLGMGVMPRRIDPAAETMPAGERDALLRHSLNRAAAAPADVPSYRDYYARAVGAQR